jgi:hypothetical protein
MIEDLALQLGVTIMFPMDISVCLIMCLSLINFQLIPHVVCPKN